MNEDRPMNFDPASLLPKPIIIGEGPSTENPEKVYSGTIEVDPRYMKYHV